MSDKKIKKPAKPKGKPIKNKNWGDTKDILKAAGYDSAEVDAAFGDTEPKYSTDIQQADVLRRFLNVT